MKKILSILLLVFTVTLSNAQGLKPSKLPELTPTVAFLPTDIMMANHKTNGNDSTYKVTIARIGAVLGIGGSIYGVQVITQLITDTFTVNGVSHFNDSVFLSGFTKIDTLRILWDEYQPGYMLSVDEQDTTGWDSDGNYLKHLKLTPKDPCAFIGKFFTKGGCLDSIMTYWDTVSTIATKQDLINIVDTLPHWNDTINNLATKSDLAAISENDWHVIGNSGTDDDNNFVGTIDAKRFNIATNGVNSIIIDTSQRVGISMSDKDSITAGLTVETTFKLKDGTEGEGLVLASDASGNASWQSVTGLQCDTCAELANGLVGYGNTANHLTGTTWFNFTLSGSEPILNVYNAGVGNGTIVTPKLQIPATTGVDYINITKATGGGAINWVLPGNGAAGTVLSDNGSGTLYWQTITQPSWGKYVPSDSDVVNGSITFWDTATYTVIDKIVYVYGAVGVSKSSDSTMTFEVDFPVGSVIGAFSNQIAGSGSATDGFTQGTNYLVSQLTIQGSPSDSKAIFKINPVGDTSTQTPTASAFRFNFSYPLE